MKEIESAGIIIHGRVLNGEERSKTVGVMGKISGFWRKEVWLYAWLVVEWNLNQGFSCGRNCTQLYNTVPFSSFKIWLKSLIGIYERDMNVYQKCFEGWKVWRKLWALKCNFETRRLICGISMESKNKVFFSFWLFGRKGKKGLLKKSSLFQFSNFFKIRRLQIKSRKVFVRTQTWDRGFRIVVNVCCGGLRKLTLGICYKLGFNIHFLMIK